jgi:hypothetical protein
MYLKDKIIIAHTKKKLLQVFSSLPDALSLPVCRQYEAAIDEVCWLVCKKNYLHREQPAFSDESVYQLFRIFCLLGETTESDPPQVCIFYLAYEIFIK